MNEWQNLTQEETELLLPYYKFRTRIYVVLLSATQIAALLFALIPLKGLLSSEDPVFYAAMLAVLLILFVLLPQVVKKVVKRQVTSLQSGHAMVYRAYVIDKHRKTQNPTTDTGHSTGTTYTIKASVPMGTQKRTENISAEEESYRKLQAGDLCNIIFFALARNEEPKLKYMEAFDAEYTAPRTYYEAYQNRMQK